MKLSALKNVVTSGAARQLLKGQKHAPVILFAAGAIGVVATVVMASRATLKLDDVLTEAQEDLERIRETEACDEYTEADQRKNTGLVYARAAGQVTRLYGPAVIVGVASIAALTGSHVILTKRYLGVTAAYAALDRTFREYRKRVVETYGLEKDQEFRHNLVDREIIEEGPRGHKTKVIKALGEKNPTLYAKFFDEGNRNWQRDPAFNRMFIQCQQAYANDRLHAVGHVFLNEVYDMLGFERTREGAVVGWIAGADAREEGDGYIDFGVFRGDVYMGQEFVNGDERSVMLDFNVDGVIWDRI
jgi:hypothetical protein